VNPAHLLMAVIATKQRGTKRKRDLAGKRAAVSKPYIDFPLFPHPTGRWAKKVRGKLCYFGSTMADPQGEAALSVWLEQRDAQLAGRTPRATGEGLTVHQFCNRICEARNARAMLRRPFPSPRPYYCLPRACWRDSFDDALQCRKFMRL